MFLLLAVGRKITLLVLRICLLWFICLQQNCIYSNSKASSVSLMHVDSVFLSSLPDRWVHVMCAVGVLEAKFVNIAERSPVDVGKIPLQRFRLVRITCASLVKFQKCLSSLFGIWETWLKPLSYLSRLSNLTGFVLCVGNDSCPCCCFLNHSLF